MIQFHNNIPKTEASYRIIVNYHIAGQYYTLHLFCWTVEISYGLAYRLHWKSFIRSVYHELRGVPRVISYFYYIQPLV